MENDTLLLCEVYEPKVPTLEEVCEAGGICGTQDIGPATITIRPVCDPDAEPIVIDCSAQMEGVTVEITNDFSERTTQCSKSPDAFIPAGKMIKIDISLAEGSYPRELTSLVFGNDVETDEEGFEIIGIDDNAGECLTPYHVTICPSGGNYELHLPYAQIYTESIELSYNVDDQRSLNFNFYGLRFPGSNRRAYIRRKPAAV